MQVFAQDDELEKLLRLKIEDLSNLKIVSVTKTFTKINEAPAAVRVITSETIKENGFFTLEEALSVLPGFQFRNIQGFNSYIFQRGIPNQNNLSLLLVDGIQINELNSGGFYGGGQFNLDDVERIEVVYGPASALYGTNAVSGIINIITKNPENDAGFRLNGLYGSFNTYNGGISYSYYNEKDEFGVRFSANIKNSEKADLSGSEGDYNWSSNMENYEKDYSINLKSRYHNLSFGLIFQNKQSSRTTNYKTTGTKYLDRNTLWNISFINSYLKYDYAFSPAINLLSTLYYRNTTINDNTVAYIIDTSQVGYYRPNNLIGLENMLSYSPFLGLSLIGGILFEYESLADDYSITYSNASWEKPPAPPKPPMENNTLFSAYLQTQYKLNESFNLYGGVRFDHSSVYDNVFTPRMGIVFNYDKLSIKLLYSEAFRAPKPWDYSFGLGNAGLKPEKMRSFEISSQYSLSQNTSVNLSIYKNKLDNIIVQESINNNYRSVNKGNVEIFGVEISLEYKENPVKSFFNYTYNSSIDSSGTMTPEIAKHCANLGITYYPFNSLDMTIRCAYYGERKNPKLINSANSYFVDDAVVIYSSVSYSGFKNYRISITVDNLLNQIYYHTSNRPPDRYRQPQRTILFKIEYSI